MTRSRDIRLATVDDAETITELLACLAQEMGDGGVFASTPEAIRHYGFGPNALFLVMLAESDGLSLFFPHFSTTRAQPGVYVQDLWVNPTQRGQNLGARLLSATAAHAAQSWGARYMGLTTHGHNDAARRFYLHLGFAGAQNDVPMALNGPDFLSFAEARDEQQDGAAKS